MNKKNDEIFEHEEGHCGECGCGSDHSHDEEDIMYLTLDDDTELECHVLGIFEVEDKEYIALLPIDEEEVIIYHYVELEDEDFELLAIEDEDEFESVSEAFNILFSEDDDYEDDDFEEYGSYDDLEEDEEE